jgi:hypothetical protein
MELEKELCYRGHTIQIHSFYPDNRFTYSICGGGVPVWEMGEYNWLPDAMKAAKKHVDAIEQEKQLKNRPPNTEVITPVYIGFESQEIMINKGKELGMNDKALERFSCALGELRVMLSVDVDTGYYKILSVEET